jgi:uracil phosphoribosyltransferase
MHEEVRHPCVQHKLSLIRDRETGHKRFRELAKEITMFVCYEALKGVRTRAVDVETPLETARCRQIAEDIVVIPILRAGVGMLEGILELVPTARVGFLGMYRNEETAEPVAYYERLPHQTEHALNIIIDPMLATGGSTIAAIDVLKKAGATKIVVVCVVTCPEGLAAVEAEHPDVMVYAAAVDAHLNDASFIVPGLGDAGDRLFGTTENTA